ncbi:helix-turn-helix domain-containing protein, partial [Bordetella pertussis]
APGQAGLDAVAQASGFGSASHLSRVFRQATAATPGQYRAGARAH